MKDECKRAAVRRQKDNSNSRHVTAMKDEVFDMKNFVKVLISGIAAVTLLAGCGSAAGTAAPGSAASPASSASTVSSTADAAGDASSTGTNSAAAAEASSSTAGNGKVLVAYFSASGNTKNIAEMIAKDTGADTFEITPADPYTDDDLDYSNENSRVSKEHEDESLQNVELTTTDVPNFDSYTTVFLGYPIWWQDASWVVNNFVKNNDFSGKTVIPFCTSSVSGIGQSGKHLEEMAGTGNWQEGQRFSSGASEEDVQKWIDSLNI